MNQNRKFFGMTIQQVGILAGLAGALCLILCIGGYLIFGGGLSPAGSQILPTVEASPTLAVIPTVTFTPAPTPIPYEQLIPTGWNQFRTARTEIWLPAGFKDTKLKLPKGAIWVAASDLVITQPASKSNTFAKSVVISYESITTDSLKSFVDLKIQSVPSTARLVDRGVNTLNTTEAIRLTFETRVDNADVNQLVYIIQDGNTVWYVLFYAQINEFYENLELFDNSIHTFRLVK